MILKSTALRSLAMPQIDLLLIDTGQPCLSNIRKMLPKDRYQIASFPDAETMLIHVMRNNEQKDTRHRCVVLKHYLKGMSGVEAQQHLRKLDPTLVSVIYSESPTVKCVIEAWRSGADDYLPYPFDDQELNDSLKRIINERRQTQESATGNNTSHEITERLTAREHDIMRLIVRGQKNTEICNTLNISLATVKMHRANLMRKLGVHNAAQLATYFHKNIDQVNV